MSSSSRFFDRFRGGWHGGSLYAAGLSSDPLVHHVPGREPFYAEAVICDQSGCYSYDQTYVYAEIHYNTDRMNGLTWGKQYQIGTHEFGHTFSLDDLFSCSDTPHIMYTSFGTCLANGPDSHAIAGVNARY